ncbi:hypothetical protein QTI66_28665 [Variovorax sp. J22R133]|uniref:hypothetical protein n=1 Tax=Variovorax brevis TaxID=3053503 RepID=UPI002574B56F|nr:hypothetical protein [Variovorax sp. J22R133]MDM0116146.1 hypothetical protein [Variovorax sp. J22R133]
MTAVLIDPALLACPDLETLQGSSQDRLLQYLSRLAELSRLRANCRSFVFWRSRDLASLLAEANRYPFRHSLANAFNALYTTPSFQLEDINRLAISLLDRSLSLEEHGQIEDVLVSECELTEDPMEDRPAQWKDHLCKLIALALPTVGTNGLFSDNTYLGSLATDKNDAIIEISCKVDLVQFRDNTYDDSIKALKAQIYNCPPASHFLQRINLVSLFKIGSAVALEDAFIIASAVESEHPWEKVQEIKGKISIGRSFIESARYLGFLNTSQKISRLIRVCADLIHERNMADSHWLREGDGANEAQRTRGEWKAWRHDIDYEFHLHYWRTGHRIELANVVTHNDFDIVR